MTISLGWWIAPLVVTLGAFIWALGKSAHTESGYLPVPSATVFLPAATIVSLVAWLVWALLR